MVIKTHKQIKSNADFNSIHSSDYFSRVFLMQISIDNLSKSFGQTPNPIENQTLSIIPTQFGIPPGFLQAKKMFQQQAHVHSHLPQLDCMELHNRPKVLFC